MSKGGGAKTTSSTSTTNQSGSGQEQGATFYGGSNTQSSSQNPWAAALPLILGSMGGLQGANATSLDQQMQALRGGQQYATAAFGGAPGTNLPQITDAVKGILGGGSTGAAGGLGGNASTALARMLSGQPDYAGLDGAISAANAPVLRSLHEDLIPQLNSRATFLNNPTGAIKSLNYALPQVADRMQQNALALTNQERLRALGDQSAGLGLYGNLTGQANGQALSAAQLLPNLLQYGLLPSQLGAQAGALPWQYATGLSGSALPFAGLGGTTDASTNTAGYGGSASTSSNNSTSTTNATSREQMSGGGLGGLLGGLLSLGSMFIPGAGPLLGGLGGLSGLFGGGGGESLGITGLSSAPFWTPK